MSFPHTSFSYIKKMHYYIDCGSAGIMPSRSAYKFVPQGLAKAHQSTLRRQCDSANMQMHPVVLNYIVISPKLMLSNISVLTVSVLTVPHAELKAPFPHILKW